MPVRKRELITPARRFFEIGRDLKKLLRADRLARALQAITENGVEDDDTGDIDVMYGDIKDTVDEDLVKQMKRMGQLEFVGSSLNDDSILTLKKL